MIRLLIAVTCSVAIVSIAAACSVAAPGSSALHGAGSAAPSAPAGSGGAAPSASLAASVSPAVAYDAFRTAACSAFDSMFVAVGNPDTGSGSILSKELDRAVEAKDGAAAERVAGVMTSELEAGRRQARLAAGHPSAAPMMTQLDRVLTAFVAMVAAKRDSANGVPGAVEPQAAFESAGGVEAWFAMLSAVQTLDRPAGAPVQQCPTVPISL